MTIGERIRNRRKELNYTQRTLSEKSGVPVITIQQYERGIRKRPNLDNVMLIAAALRTSIMYLYGVTDDPDDPKYSDLVEHEMHSLEQLIEDEMQETEQLNKLDGAIMEAVLELVRTTMKICLVGHNTDLAPQRIKVINKLITDSKDYLEFKFAEIESQAQGNTAE